MNHFRVHQQLMLAMGVALCTAGAAHADTLEVPVPYSTIQDCIDAATDGDECVVADGVFTGPGNRDLDFGGKAITLRSQSGDPASCIIDCELAARFAVYREGDTAVFEDLTIRNGNTAGAGGAALVLNAASPSFHNCVFESNTAGVDIGDCGNCDFAQGMPGCSDAECEDLVCNLDSFCCDTSWDGLCANLALEFCSCSDGGAIYARSASLELVDTVFDGNEGNRGGAVVVDGGEITVSGCTFTLNTSRPGWAGGALRAFGSALVNFTNSLVESNTSGGGGGGIYVSGMIDPASVFSKCQFKNNQAPNGPGGGLAFTGSSSNFLVSECVFEGNSAGAAGGLLIRHGTPASRVQNCVFRANVVSGSGGGP